jgi:hypothetical protein
MNIDEFKENMSYSTILSLNERYQLKENVNHGKEHITDKPKLLTLGQGDNILFKGWWEHQGVKQTGYVVRMFAYITGGVHWQLPKAAGAGTSIRKENSFFIRKSNIPGAGRGVFTITTIPSGQHITSYPFHLVDMITFKNSDSDKKLSHEGYHCIGVSVNNCRSNNFGAMINRSINSKNNCNFRMNVFTTTINNKDMYNVEVNIYSTKEIKGSLSTPVELYMPYGTRYRSSNFSNNVDINTDNVNEIVDDNNDSIIHNEKVISNKEDESSVISNEDENLTIDTVKCFRGGFSE